MSGNHAGAGGRGQAMLGVRRRGAYVRERARMSPEPRAHTSSVGGRRATPRSAIDGRIVLRTERLLLTPLTRLDEAEHASASRRPADALRDTGAAEVQWRGGGVGPLGVRGLREGRVLRCAGVGFAGGGVDGVEPGEGGGGGGGGGGGREHRGG